MHAALDGKPARAIDSGPRRVTPEATARGFDAFAELF
jgi:hypothetical protein